ncbi:hypothetical protein CJD36_006465 [Flavipsychrobacter stenotrophus]|uniref:Uncharacterized protein n=1 Tax=Flavipsychrobacter stenotrophus TaxID=2077091 RepID=A0A2S7SXT7_9BACT|nr:hypothetical protein CJD36_006465 [Flavipsychrobacter stenotrophus]
MIGYNALPDTGTAYPALFSTYGIGTIDLPGGVTGNLASLSRSINRKTSGEHYQGAYNTSDNCYYTFIDSGSHPRLCKITSSGVVSIYQCITDSVVFESLVYNAVTNKLLALNHGLADTLVEITTSGSSFSYTPIAQLANEEVRYSSATVDQTTGTLYVAANFYTPSCYRVLKIAPGAATFSMVDSQSSQLLDAIEYSNTDHMLYAFRHLLNPAQTLLYFVRIDPAGGSSTVSTSPITIGRYFSSTFDQCNNRYIASNQKYTVTGSSITWSSDSSAVLQIDPSGSLVQTNYLSGLFLGIAVKP